MTNIESSNQNNISGLILGVLFLAMISGILIWIVSLHSLSLAVDGIGTAFLAGLAVAITGGVISWPSASFQSELTRLPARQKRTSSSRNTRE